MADAAVSLQAQFKTAEQQREAATLGMWVFLSSEVLFFGAMMMAYAVYRYLYPEAFVIAGKLMNKSLGTINTGLLLTSSLCAAGAVHAAKNGRRRILIGLLAATALIGLLFDGLKFYEYLEHFKDHLLPGVDASGLATAPAAANMFFILYYVMTGVHALHVLIGVVLFTTLTLLIIRRSPMGEPVTTIENSALYWHFVDIVWIFLYPLFYLVGGR